MVEKVKPKKSEEIPYLFKDSFFSAEKSRATKALAFPIAFLLHATLVAAMIVLPLLQTENLPTVEVYSTFLAPPPPPHLLHRHQLKNVRVPKPGLESSLFKPGLQSSQDSLLPL